ncbi:hypothetical protein GALMADRAFT_251621 [Galerina marginata CBS 339.88]|uniref:Uncharacterized protein n=1 Tax=Galerina marginata (strain CBS 339.88) TaxID=685588 RepID=A0A067SS67_GALM3|nr:hypothetical protein GALMADRAFT_251621 [Galerina marginata CBS 339.88]
MAAICEPLEVMVREETLDAHIALPAEIINNIIDVLGHDKNCRASIQALRVFALVSRVLCMRAHHYLFSEFKIAIVPTSDVEVPLGRLLRTLVTSLRFPDLGMVYHIRSASFIFEMKYQYFIEGSISNNDVLPRIMDALHGPNHGVSSFGLEVYFAGPGFRLRPTWSDIGPKLNTAFYNLCRSRNLKSLRLKSFADVPRVQLLHGTSIKHLILEDVGVGSSYQVMPISDRPRIFDWDDDFASSIGHMFTRGDDAFYFGPQDATSIWTSLYNPLEFSHTGFNPNAEHDAKFKQAFADITSLTLSVGGLDQSPGLRNLPQLRSLHLLQLLNYPKDPEGVILPVNDFFSFEDNAVPPSLAHLSIEIRASTSCFVDRRKDTQGTGIISLPWVTFGSDMNGSKFESIQDIHLVIHLGRDLEPFISHEVTVIEETEEIILFNLSALVALRQSTFSLDIVLDEFQPPCEVGKPGIRLGGTPRYFGQCHWQ